MRMSDFFVQQDGVNAVTNTNGGSTFVKLNELERMAIGVGFCINSSN